MYLDIVYLKKTITRKREMYDVVISYPVHILLASSSNVNVINVLILDRQKEDTHGLFLVSDLDQFYTYKSCIYGNKP